MARASKAITKRAVEALKPGQVLWDGEVRGFGVRRQPAPADNPDARRDPVYVLKYRFKGRQRFYSIGRHGSPYTVDGARTVAQRLLGQVADGIDPAGRRDADKGQPTVAEFFDRYCAEYSSAHKKPRSIAGDRGNFRLHIASALGHMRLGDVTRADVARLHSGRAAHKANANRCLVLVSHLFNVAAKWGVLPEGAGNPARGIEKYPEKRRERMLSAAELARLGEALARAATGWTDAEWKAIPAKDRPARQSAEDARAIACYRLLLFTGARLNEILSLRWEWIDFARGVARLPDSKTGAKNLHLSAPALVLLQGLERYEGNPYVLPGDRMKPVQNGDPNKAEPQAFVGIQKPWQRIRKAAKLDGLRIHDLRHAFASLAVANNETIYLVGAVLGHRQVTTTERYAHLSADPVKAVADRTAERVAAMLSGTKLADVLPIRRGRK